MDNYADERDYKLLEGDKYTFSVLSRIIRGENSLLLTDHERIIVCFTGQPYPVWIWTPDDATEGEMERAFGLAGENGFLDGEHHFNMKYELAEFFINRAKDEGMQLVITMNMYAYDCLEPVAPQDPAEGEMHKCTEEDVDVAVDFFEDFFNAVGIDQQSREEYLTMAKENISDGYLYLWKDPEGRFVSSCNWHPANDLASIGLVYTRNEERRKHYAEHLVYQVTLIAKDAGYTPMLYTDADYTASNACYEKIGYVLRGKLCTVGVS